MIHTSLTQYCRPDEDTFTQTHSIWWQRYQRLYDLASLLYACSLEHIIPLLTLGFLGVRGSTYRLGVSWLDQSQDCASCALHDNAWNVGLHDSGLCSTTNHDFGVLGVTLGPNEGYSLPYAAATLVPFSIRSAVRCDEPVCHMVSSTITIQAEELIVDPKI